MKSSHRAVFLDRDGTILRERGYLGDPSKMTFYPFAFAALRRLKKAGFKLVVVSNQSGVARGYFSARQLENVNRVFKRKLSANGVRLDGLYTCPHLPTDGCRCRKPRPGMALQAARDLNLDLKRSYVIGDQDRDMILADRVRARGILVLTGAGRRFRSFARRRGFRISATIEYASRWVTQNP